MENIVQSVSWGMVGALAFTIAMILFYKRQIKHKRPPGRDQVVLMALAGIGISGTGWVGKLVHTVADTAAHGSVTWGSQVLGVGASLLVTVAVVFWIVHDWRTKDIEVFTPWLSLIAPVLVMIVFGIGSISDVVGSPTSLLGG